MRRWRVGREGGRRKGTLVPGGTWVWEGSEDGRWPHTLWSCLASLHCCDSSIRVSETIFSMVQWTRQAWGPALSIQAPSLLLCTRGLCFFRLSPLVLKSCSCLCPSSLGVPASCSPTQPLFSFLLSLFFS